MCQLINGYSPVDMVQRMREASNLKKLVIRAERDAPSNGFLSDILLVGMQLPAVQQRLATSEELVLDFGYVYSLDKAAQMIAAFGGSKLKLMTKPSIWQPIGYRDDLRDQIPVRALRPCHEDLTIVGVRPWPLNWQLPKTVKRLKWTFPCDTGYFDFADKHALVNYYKESALQQLTLVNIAMDTLVGWFLRAYRLAPKLEAIDLSINMGKKPNRARDSISILRLALAKTFVPPENYQALKQLNITLQCHAWDDASIDMANKTMKEATNIIARVKGPTACWKLVDDNCVCIAGDPDCPDYLLDSDCKNLQKHDDDSEQLARAAALATKEEWDRKPELKKAPTDLDIFPITIFNERGTGVTAYIASREMWNHFMRKTLVEEGVQPEGPWSRPIYNGTFKERWVYEVQSPSWALNSDEPPVGSSEHRYMLSRCGSCRMPNSTAEIPLVHLVNAYRTHTDPLNPSQNGRQAFFEEHPELALQ